MARKSMKTAEPKTEAVKTAPIAAPAVKEEIKVEAPVKEAQVKEAAKAVKEVPSEKKPASKKAPAAKRSTVKKTSDKSSATKATAKAPAKAAKPETKAAGKSAAKTTKSAAKTEPAAKRGGRRPKELTAEDICAKLTKRASKTKAAKIVETIAVELKIYGWENNNENHKFIYIEVKNGKLTVAPYQYDDCTLKADIPLADIAAFADGKIPLMDAKIYAAGNFGDALKLASLFE